MPNPLEESSLGCLAQFSHPPLEVGLFGRIWPGPPTKGGGTSLVALFAMFVDDGMIVGNAIFNNPREPRAVVAPPVRLTHLLPPSWPMLPAGAPLSARSPAATLWTHRFARSCLRKGDRTADRTGSHPPPPRACLKAKALEGLEVMGPSPAATFPPSGSCHLPGSCQSPEPLGP